jgi:tripartite-type tricarboxylate transporter receptor subunit TctC
MARTPIVAALAALSLLLAPCGARAAYPERVITLIVPFAAGGPTDIIARIVSVAFQKSLGQSVVVENRGGGGGNPGMAIAARAAPDGYTLLLCNVSCAANQFLLGNTAFDPDADVAPVIVLGNVPNVLVAGPGVSATTLAEFIAFARANPGKVSMASSGPGSSSHLSALLLKVKAQIDIVDVPYRGSSAAMPDILSGRVDAMVMGLPESLPFVRDGKLKALGVTPDKRASALPEVPTFAQAGVGDYSFLGWLSLFVPQRTPAALSDKLNAAFGKSLQSPALLARFAEQSIEPVGGAAELAARLLKSDVVLWRQILKTNRAD